MQILLVIEKQKKTKEIVKELIKILKLLNAKCKILIDKMMLFLIK
jgi:hypothetical protein